MIIGHKSAPDVDSAPYAARWELIEACRQLTDAQARDVLRSRLLPFIVMPGEILYAAAGKHGIRTARRRNVEVVALAKADDLLHALQTVFGKQILYNSRLHLANDSPQFSASRRLTLAQSIALMCTLTGLALAIWLAPSLTGVIVMAGFSILFLAVVAIRLGGMMPAFASKYPPVKRIADKDLPVYTVLVPLFRETRIIDQLLTGLGALHYPSEKLDIKIILEEKDPEMHRAFDGLVLPEHFEVIVVPDAQPQTKPKALNYALHFARGELAVIFDAEDIPEPNQLRLAAGTFAASDKDLVCLQASLTFYNANENWLTRQFTIEYAVLFDLVLPFLASLHMPLPLGGTSNHFKMCNLRQLGAWDPFNVTEDADLGMRLARFGWRADVLASSTYEEANNALASWISQRARWLKGWMQTWFVHMRHPLTLWRQLGPGGFLVMQVITFGVIFSTLAHPVFLVLTIWAIATGQFLPLDQNVGSTILIGVGLAVLVAGYTITLASGFAALRLRGLTRLWPSVLAMPLYWLLVSAGGWLALKQFITHPFHWNKTEHGLSKLKLSHRRSRRSHRSRR